MYLKRIEMFGFKSFAQSTPLEFNPGITSIVGPNGCGKSNVADALRWVMGIQAPKALRGRRMEDIIFNGTRIHKPLGRTGWCLCYAFWASWWRVTWPT